MFNFWQYFKSFLKYKYCAWRSKSLSSLFSFVFVVWTGTNINHPESYIMSLMKTYTLVLLKESLLAALIFQIWKPISVGIIRHGTKGAHNMASVKKNMQPQMTPNWKNKTIIAQTSAHYWYRYRFCLW